MTKNEKYLRIYTDDEILSEYKRRFSVYGNQNQNKGISQDQIERINKFLDRQVPRIENRLVISTNNPEVLNHPYFKHLNDNPRLHHPFHKEFNDKDIYNL